MWRDRDGAGVRKAKQEQERTPAPSKPSPLFDDLVGDPSSVAHADNDRLGGLEVNVLSPLLTCR